MVKLLVNGAPFERIRSESWNESDYENLIVGHAATLFPMWRCVPFTETIEGDGGVRKKPDLAFVDPQYREWWVVEIELATHDLYGHVLPQVEAFRTGQYEARHAAALHRAAPDLDLGRLEAMVGGDPPNVLVVVDSPSTNWRAPLRDARVSLAIAEPFRDHGASYAFRLNGDQPEPHPAVLSRCSRHSMIRRFWKVHSPAVIPPGTESLAIEFDGVVTTWDVCLLQGAVMLSPDRGDVLGDERFVDLVQRDDGELAFRLVTRRLR